MEFDTLEEAMLATPDGTGEVSFPWGDATFAFHLDYKQIMKLEAKTDMGVGRMLRLIPDGHLRLEYMREIIRHGMLGAGMEIEKVEGAMRRNFADQPLQKVREVAYAIVHHVEYGPVINPQPQQQQPGKAGRRSQKEAGVPPSPHSSETPAQSA